MSGGDDRTYQDGPSAPLRSPKLGPFLVGWRAVSPGNRLEVESMKWILVVLIGGVTPVQTDVQFEKLSDCLSAEEQLRNTYAEAYDAWDKSAAINIERRRDYRKARQFQERRLANTGTCIPHANAIVRTS